MGQVCALRGRRGALPPRVDAHVDRRRADRNAARGLVDNHGVEMQVRTKATEQRGKMMGRRSHRKVADAVKHSAPTPERLAKAGEHFTVGTGEGRVLTFTDNPFARAHTRGVVTTKQYEAGQKYHIHWFHAGLSDALGSADLNRVFASDVSSFSGMAKTEAQVFHRQRWREARKVVGSVGATVLDMHICADQPLEAVGYALRWRNKPQAISAATERLREALDRLLMHWQL